MKCARSGHATYRRLKGGRKGGNGESMGKVYCVGRYSVVETIQIKLVGSTLERQPAMIFFERTEI